MKTRPILRYALAYTTLLVFNLLAVPFVFYWLDGVIYHGQEWSTPDVDRCIQGIFPLDICGDAWHKVLSLLLVGVLWSIAFPALILFDLTSEADLGVVWAINGLAWAACVLGAYSLFRSLRERI
jgi:hypothetical protein